MKVSSARGVLSWRVDSRLDSGSLEAIESPAFFNDADGLFLERLSSSDASVAIVEIVEVFEIGLGISLQMGHHQGLVGLL